MFPPGTQPYIAYISHQSCARASETFRFLDLPKDIRLVFHDLLPTVTRYHSLSTRQRYSLKIVNQHAGWLALMRACRLINDEAVALRRKLDDLHNEPLRLVVHWRSVDGFTLQGVLQCAAMDLAECGGSFGLDLLLPQRATYVPRYQTSLSPAGLDRIHVQTRAEFDIQCPFASQKELHAILHRRWPLEVPRNIEIAIGCTGGLLEGEGTVAR